MGRPPEFTQDIADNICSRLASGESLRKICSDESMPSIVSVWRWLNKYPDFSKQYAQAREAQAEYYADEIVEIADTADKDTANAVRVQVDARKWVASKLRPKKYGELVKHEHGGADGAPIPVSISVSYERPG